MKESFVIRELSNVEVSQVSGGAGTATFTGSSWSYGNACYATAQDAARAGATGFKVGQQYFGNAGNPFDAPCIKEDGCTTASVSYQIG